MTAPAFTVVIPLFNKAGFIRATVASVLAQDHPDFELILVDDGSTDGSAEAVGDLLGPRVRLIRQDNAGPGPARNRGIAEASGDWIALLDADDRWRPNHLSVLAGLVHAFPAAGAVTTGFRRISPGDADALQAVRPAPGPGRLIDYFMEARRRELICSSSAAVRRDAAQALGGFAPFRPGEDMHFWVRLALDHPIAATPTETALYVMAADSLMHAAGRDPAAGLSLQPVFEVLDRALADPARADLHPRLRAYRNCLLENWARQALRRGDPSTARFYLGHVEPASFTGSALRLLSRLPPALAATGLAGLGAALRLVRGRRA